MKTELILAVRADHEYDMTLPAALSENAVIAQREWLESNPAFRHIIPYIVVARTTGDEPEYFVYNRTKVSGETRLVGKTSIGLGGHIELEDIVPTINNTIDFKETVLRSTFRELEEEIKFHDDKGNNVNSIVIMMNPFSMKDRYDVIKLDTTPMESVHLGIIALLHTNEPFTINDPSLDSPRWLTKKQLREEPNLEVWSQFIVDSDRLS